MQYCQIIDLSHNVRVHTALIDLTNNVQSHKTVNICPPVNIRTWVVGYPVPNCKTIHPQIFTEGGEPNKVFLINHK